MINKHSFIIKLFLGIILFFLMGCSNKPVKTTNYAYSIFNNKLLINVVIKCKLGFGKAVKVKESSFIVYCKSKANAECKIEFWNSQYRCPDKKIAELNLCPGENKFLELNTCRSSSIDFCYWIPLRRIECYIVDNNRIRHETIRLRF